MMPTEMHMALVKAASKGDLLEIQGALQAGANINENRGEALRRAAGYGHTEAVVFLINHGADIHALDDAALRIAVQNDCFDMVCRLLSLGANPDERGGDILERATRYGQTRILERLLMYSRCAPGVMDSLLCDAAYGGHLEIVLMLAQRGADPFVNFGMPLATAEFGKHEEMAEFLRETMAKKKKEFIGDMLSAADVKVWLRQNYWRTTEAALIRACKLRCLGEAVSAMVAAGDTLTIPDMLELKDRGGKTFLQLAAQGSQIDQVLDIRLWKTLEEMQKVWGRVPNGWRPSQKTDMAAITAAWRQRRLKEMKQKTILTQQPRSKG